MFWPTVYKSEERYAGINGTVAQGRNPPLFLVFIVCRDSLSFLRYKEVDSENCKKKFKLQNCTSDALIHPVDSWGKIRQYKWHSCTGEIPTFIFGTAYMPIFFVVSEIQGTKLQKLSKKYKFSYFWGHRVETPWPIWKILHQNVRQPIP